VGELPKKGNARGINVLAASHRTNSPTFLLLFCCETARKKIKNYGTDLSTCGTESIKYRGFLLCQEE